MPDPNDILTFWFSDAVTPYHFRKDPDFDRRMTEQFLETYQQAVAGALDHWCDSAEGCLALVIVLDQFPL